MEQRNITTKAQAWFFSDDGNSADISDFYCERRDVFRARLERFTSAMAEFSHGEEAVALGSAIVGEIGNNAFDHNIGTWRDAPGIFFGYEQEAKTLRIIVADRGQGVFHSLKRVKTDLADDKEALHTAFFEKISGRAPEKRGNGLKFVRSVLAQINAELLFYSGMARVRTNHGTVVEEVKENYNGCFVVIEIKL